MSIFIPFSVVFRSLPTHVLYFILVFTLRVPFSSHRVKLCFAST